MPSSPIIDTPAVHGDILSVGIDHRARLYVDLYDANRSICIRCYEDKRVTRARERERQQVLRN